MRVEVEDVPRSLMRLDIYDNLARESIKRRGADGDEISITRNFIMNNFDCDLLASAVRAAERQNR